MIPKTLDAITEADLQELVDSKVPEGKTIEYKISLPGGQSDEKVKFLRAVSSLANTAGGDLFYGVQAVDGIPTALPGLIGVNEDDLRLRLENLCRDGLQERIRSLHFRFIALKSSAPEHERTAPRMRSMRRSSRKARSFSARPPAPRRGLSQAATRPRQRATP